MSLGDQPLTATTAAALDTAIEIYIAREDFSAFCRRIDSEWTEPPHLTLLIRQLIRLEGGEINRLFVAMPPRSGKTETVVRKFISWWLGRRRGKTQVVIATASETLALQHSNDIIRTVSGNERYPFHEFGLASSAAALWNTTTGGIVRAVGVGSQLSGFGADLLVLDDLVKDAADAYSPLVQQSHAEWLGSVAMTRLMPKAKVIVIGTRWSEGDIMGRILDGSDVERWTKVVLPAIALEDDPLGREPGAALWPERYPIEELEAQQQLMGSRAFSALYQCNPVATDSGVFQRSWFDRRFSEVPTQSRPFHVDTHTRFKPIETYYKPVLTAMAIDTASKTHSGADWTVICTFVCDFADYYLIDVRRERVEFPDLVRMITQAAADLRPDAIYIEEAGPSGIAIAQELRHQTMLPIIPVRPEGNKVARASAISAICEAKKVTLPERARWIPAFLDEMCAFPAGRHDDQVDAFSLGLSSIRNVAARYVFEDRRWQRNARQNWTMAR